MAWCSQAVEQKGEQNSNSFTDHDVIKRLLEFSQGHIGYKCSASRSANKPSKFRIHSRLKNHR